MLNLFCIIHSPQHRNHLGMDAYRGTLMDTVELTGTQEPTRLLTPKEVAALLRVKEPTVRSWLRSGKLEGLNVGYTWRVPLTALQALSNRKAG